MKDARKQQPRVELDPPTTASTPAEADAPPEKAAQKRADDPDIASEISTLISKVGGEPDSFDGRLIRDMMVTALKLIPDERDTGELKLMTSALKELRYAYRVFAQYPEQFKISIFGSARTPPEHPDYIAAVEFSKLIAQAGWMVITGAGDGIMKAGHEGPGREASFGVAIRLPFETTANEVIAGDEKLIHFRYFFTRKLMFLSQAEAVALFPGGFGTMDEAYETLTLVQTGKASMIPIVLLEGEGRDYWEEWRDFNEHRLLRDGWISEEDLGLFKIAKTPAEAVEHVTRFYRNYHSSRYVRDELVIRLHRKLKDEDVQRLSDEFKILIKRGEMTQVGAFPEEDDHLELPRLTFTHTRYKFGLIRRLIDRINDLDPA